MQFSPEVEQALTAAANRYGLPVSYMRTIVQLESGGNPLAKNPSSSAGGLLQFTDGTARQYGLSNKFDPYQSADAGARLMMDNYKGLQRTLGREPTVGELYLAHQQGLGGATKLLSNPNAPAASLVGGKAVTLNGGQAGMSGQQFANLWVNKANKIGGVPVASPPASGAMAMAPQAGMAVPLPGSVPAMGAAVPAAATPASPMGGVMGLLLQAKMAQAAPAPVGAAPPKPKVVDNRSDEEKLAAVSQTPDVYLKRLKRRASYV